MLLLTVTLFSAGPMFRESALFEGTAVYIAFWDFLQYLDFWVVMTPQRKNLGYPPWGPMLGTFWGILYIGLLIRTIKVEYGRNIFQKALLPVIIYSTLIYNAILTALSF